MNAWFIHFYKEAEAFWNESEYLGSQLFKTKAEIQEATSIYREQGKNIYASRCSWPITNKQTIEKLESSKECIIPAEDYEDYVIM